MLRISAVQIVRAVVTAIVLSIAILGGTWLGTSMALAEPPAGNITISIAEYDRLKEAVEGKEKDKFWKMTFQQILVKKNNDATAAWRLYEYYVLRTVYLNGTVDNGSVSRLIGDFSVLSEIDPKAPITLVISSGGGYVFEGLRLYNAMMASPTPINTVCDGLAMSMAAVLLSAGDHRTARSGCAFMIHEMAGGAPGGQTTEQVKTADIYISLENELWRILSENSGFSVADLLTLAEFETWWTADEAFALGFVDEVVADKPREIVAGSRAIPADLLPRERISRHVVERMKR